MRGAPVGIAAAVIIAIVLGGAYLLFETSTVCGCGSQAARSISLTTIEDAPGYWVEAATPGLRYGDVDVWVDGALVSLSGNIPPRYGEWSVFGEDGMPAGPGMEILAGHVIHVSGPGESTQFIDREQNSIMLQIGPLPG